MNEFLIILLAAAVSIAYGAGTGFYTAEERTALEKLRSTVELDDLRYIDYMNSDAFLFNWLRDQNMDVERAGNKLRKSIEWRKKHNIDKIRSDYSLKELEPVAPYSFGGYDNTGNPIAEVYFGNWDLRKVALTGKMPKLRSYMHQMMELGYTEAQLTSQNVTQWVILANVAGFTPRTQACTRCFVFYLNFFDDFESNYPGTVKYIIGVNSPRIFDIVARYIRPLMSPGTRDGFHIFGHNKEEYGNFLFSMTKRDQLTREFGGTRINVKSKPY